MEQARVVHCSDVQPAQAARHQAPLLSCSVAAQPAFEACLQQQQQQHEAADDMEGDAPAAAAPGIATPPPLAPIPVSIAPCDQQAAPQQQQFEGAAGAACIANATAAGARDTPSPVCESNISDNTPQALRARAGAVPASAGIAGSDSPTPAATAAAGRAEAAAMVAAQQKGSTGSSGASHHPSPTVLMHDGSSTAAASPESVMPATLVGAAAAHHSLQLHRRLLVQQQPDSQQLSSMQHMTGTLPLEQLQEPSHRPGASTAGAAAAAGGSAGLLLAHQQQQSRQQDQEQEEEDEEQASLVKQQLVRSPRVSATTSEPAVLAAWAGFGTATPHSGLRGATPPPHMQLQGFAGQQAAGFCPAGPPSSSNLGHHSPATFNAATPGLHGPAGMHPAGMHQHHQHHQQQRQQQAGMPAGFAGGMQVLPQPEYAGSRGVFVPGPGQRPYTPQYYHHHHHHQQQQPHHQQQQQHQPHPGIYGVPPPAAAAAGGGGGHAHMQDLTAQYCFLTQQQQALREQLHDLQEQERQLMLRRQASGNAAGAPDAELPTAGARSGYDPQLLAAWHSFTSEMDSPVHDKRLPPAGQQQPQQHGPSAAGGGPQGPQQQAQAGGLLDQGLQPTCSKSSAGPCDTEPRPDQQQKLQQLQRYASAPQLGLVAGTAPASAGGRAEPTPAHSSSDGGGNMRQEVAAVVADMLDTVVAMSVRSSSTSAAAAAVDAATGGAAAVAASQGSQGDDELTSSGDNEAAACADMCWAPGASSQQKQLQDQQRQEQAALPPAAAAAAPAGDTVLAVTDSCSPLVPAAHRTAAGASGPAANGGGVQQAGTRAGAAAADQGPFRTSASGGGVDPATAPHQQQHQQHQQQASAGPGGAGDAPNGLQALMGLDLFELDDDLAPHGMMLDDLLNLGSPRGVSSAAAATAASSGHQQQQQQQQHQPADPAQQYRADWVPADNQPGLQPQQQQQRYHPYGGSTSAGGALQAAPGMRQHHGHMPGMQQSALMHAHRSMPGPSGLQAWQPSARPTVTTASNAGFHQAGHPHVVSTFQQQQQQHGIMGHYPGYLQAGGNPHGSNPGNLGLPGHHTESYHALQQPGGSRLASMGSCPPGYQQQHHHQQQQQQQYGSLDGVHMHQLPPQHQQQLPRSCPGAEHGQHVMSPQPGWPGSSCSAGPHSHMPESLLHGARPALDSAAEPRGVHMMLPADSHAAHMQDSGSHGGPVHPYYHQQQQHQRQQQQQLAMQQQQAQHPEGSPFCSDQYRSLAFSGTEPPGLLSGPLVGQLSGPVHSSTLHQQHHQQLASHASFHQGGILLSGSGACGGGGGGSYLEQHAQHTALQRVASAPVMVHNGNSSSPSPGLQPGLSGAGRPQHMYSSSSATDFGAAAYHYQQQQQHQQHYQHQQQLSGYSSMPHPGALGPGGIVAGPAGSAVAPHPGALGPGPAAGGMHPAALDPGSQGYRRSLTEPGAAPAPPPNPRGRPPKTLRLSLNPAGNKPAQQQGAAGAGGDSLQQGLGSSGGGAQRKRSGNGSGPETLKPVKSLKLERSGSLGSSGHGGSSIAAPPKKKSGGMPVPIIRNGIMIPPPAGPEMTARGKPTFADLVQAGAFPSGCYEFSVGTVQSVTASVGSNGIISYGTEQYQSISSFALAAARSRNPNRQACDGWKEVRLQGKKLELWRQAFLNKLPPPEIPPGCIRNSPQQQQQQQGGDGSASNPQQQQRQQPAVSAAATAAAPLTACASTAVVSPQQWV